MIVEVRQGDDIEIIDNITAFFIDAENHKLIMEINRETGPFMMDRIIDLDENTVVRRPSGTVLYENGVYIPPAMKDD